jgi:hypothetical protein
MASGLIMGLSNGIGGIVATFLGWVADQWGIPFTLQVIFLFPLLGFLTFLFIPYPPPIHSTSSASSRESSPLSPARQADPAGKSEK